MAIAQEEKRMSDFEIYVFILCLIVFLMFTALFSSMIVTMTQMKLKLVKNGLEDDEIKKEYEKRKKSKRGWAIVGKVFSVILCVILLAAFAFSVYMNATKDKAPNGIPSIKVVKSDSMSYKNEKNTYLTENGIDNQLQTFDVIVTHHLPPEEELQVYDIVVYKVDDYYIIHRIVAIEEPNESHPNERRFLLQGDAVSSPDRFPVLYSQMQGIYRDQRVPFVGSFVLFLQSPAGWLCILLLLAAAIATPIVQKKIENEEKKRIDAMEAAALDSEKTGTH